MSLGISECALTWKTPIIHSASSELLGLLRLLAYLLCELCSRPAGTENKTPWKQRMAERITAHKIVRAETDGRKSDRGLADRFFYKQGTKPNDYTYIWLFVSHHVWKGKASGSDARTVSPIRPSPSHVSLAPWTQSLWVRQLQHTHTKPPAHTLTQVLTSCVSCVPWLVALPLAPA